jgi:HK97 family phage portal protein
MSDLTIFGALKNVIVRSPVGLQQPASRGREWWPVIREPFTGAWQRNQEQRVEGVLSFSPLFRCVTLIASDIAKNRMMLVEEVAAGIWDEVSSPAFSPVLRKPNHYQTRQQFLETWMISKLAHGNAFGLKQRDARGVVIDIYILDPLKTKPLVAPNGDVYYELSNDDLSQVFGSSVIVPASEMIHDRWNTLFHPLVGLSPIYACGLAAVQGLSIQRSSSTFFQNGSTAPGILSAPGDIPDATADRIKAHWEQNYTGDNSKKVAVLGSGLAFSPMSFNAVDSQLTEQLKGSAESVCTAFGVPAYKIGVGQMPTYNNIESLRLEYYASALQQHVEAIEALLDEALGLDQITGKTYGVEFDLDNLLRMDTATMIKAEAEAVGAGIKMPNEARKRLGLGKVKGGDTPYLQQQNFSLAALAKRDSQDDPFASGNVPEPKPVAAPTGDDNIDEAAAKQIAAWSLKQSLESLPALNLLAA